MRRINNVWFARTIVLLVIVLTGVLGQAPAFGQVPQPPGSQLPDLKPSVKFLSVSLNGGPAKTLGVSLTGLPTQPPAFEVPRNPVDGTSWVLEFRTRDGRGTITFSNTAPGIAANAFQWEQSSGASPGAIGRLRYNGCASCTASFTFEVTIKDNLDFSGAAPKAQVKLNLTASGGPPRLISVARTGDNTIRPQFQLTFRPGTFAAEDSEVVAIYPGGLKYRLLPENIGQETMMVVIERLKASHNVEVILRNPYGISVGRPAELPTQRFESGPNQHHPVSDSVTSGDADIRGQYSIQHRNFGPFEATGTDEITVAPRYSGATPCDQPDFIYHSAVMKWIRNDGYSGDTDNTGTVRISSQPPVDHLLRSPDNKLRIAWTLKALKGDQYYQVMFGRIEVVGVCANRVVQ